MIVIKYVAANTPLLISHLMMAMDMTLIVVMILTGDSRMMIVSFDYTPW